MKTILIILFSSLLAGCGTFPGVQQSESPNGASLKLADDGKELHRYADNIDRKSKLPEVKKEAETETTEE